MERYGGDPRALRLTEFVRATPALATLHQQKLAGWHELLTPEIARRLGSDPHDATDLRPHALIAAASAASTPPSRPRPPETERSNCPMSSTARWTPSTRNQATQPGTVRPAPAFRPPSSGEPRGLPGGHTGMHARLGAARQAGTRRQHGPSVAVRGPVRGRPCKADGLPHRSLAPIPVRYASVEPAAQRSTARQGDTRWDREETPR
jgi:hypothetical protein